MMVMNLIQVEKKMTMMTKKTLILIEKKKMKKLLLMMIQFQIQLENLFLPQLS